MLWGPGAFLHDLCLEHLLGTGGGLEQKAALGFVVHLCMLLWGPRGREVRVVASLHFSLVVGSKDGEGSWCAPPYPGLAF